MIYLDNAATTKVIPESAQGVSYAMTEAFGNPSSLHGMGVEAERLISFSRRQILSAIGVASGSSDYDVIFTSGATEANNTAIFGIASEYGKRKRRIVTTAVEHPSVEEAFCRLGKLGYEVVTVFPDESGQISAQALIDAVNENTCLVSAMLVNNETGYILPVASAFEAIKRRYPDCITHSDCVQGFEKIKFSARKLCADIITLSGHKIHAPKGIGALCIKKGIRLSPLIYGGGQQNGLRSGTEPVPLIYGMGKAVSALTPTIAERYAHVSEINDYARSRIESIGHIISGQDASPYILSIALPGFKSETLLHFLEARQIYVSSGSACSKGKKSSVLDAFRVGEKYIDSVLRLSFSCETAKSDIDALVQALKEAVGTLAGIKN